MLHGWDCAASEEEGLSVLVNLAFLEFCEIGLKSGCLLCQVFICKLFGSNGLAQDTEPCGDFWGLALVRRSRVLGFNVLECAKDVELVICGFLALGLTFCQVRFVLWAWLVGW